VGGSGLIIYFLAVLSRVFLSCLSFRSDKINNPVAMTSESRQYWQKEWIISA
jgi:hypothetical protein